MPSPIPTEIGVSVPILGWVTVVWGVLAGVYLVATAGVASRRRWGRALAGIIAAVQVTLSGLTLVAALIHADLASMPGGFVEIGLAGVVLYGGLPMASGRRPELTAEGNAATPAGEASTYQWRRRWATYMAP